MARFKHRGSVHVFEKKKEAVWPYVVGGLFVLLLIGAAMDSEAGEGQDAPQGSMSTPF